MPSFDRIRYRRHDASVFLYAFDLIELSGDDLRREPLETRKATLKSVLTKAGPGLRLNEHIEADGPTVFAHACKMGLEGIFEAQGLDVPLRPFARLAQVQEPCVRSGEARGGRRLGQRTAMTIFTMRRVGGDFVVTGPDIEPKKFKTRREVRDWCTLHYPAHPLGRSYPFASARPAKERQAAAGEQGRQGNHHPAAPAVKREAEEDWGRDRR